MAISAIELSVSMKDVEKRYEVTNGRNAGLFNFSLDISRNETCAVVGPSGSGKTTLGLLLAGLLAPEKGSIYLSGCDVTRTQAFERSRAGLIYICFQGSAGLLPNLSVLDNILLGTKECGIGRGEAVERVKSACNILFPEYTRVDSLDQLLAKRPFQLSGGERQRVSIAKAMIRRPKIVVWDESFNAIDASLRVDIRRKIQEWRFEYDITQVWITHDHHEAVAVADKIAVLDHGKLLQVGNTFALFHTPSHIKVGTFVSMGLGQPLNLFEGVLKQDNSGSVRFVAPEISIPLKDCVLVPNRKVIAGIRSSQLTLSELPTDSSVKPVSIVGREFNSEWTDLVCRSDTENYIVRTQEKTSAPVHSKGWLRTYSEPILFDLESGIRIP